MEPSRTQRLYRYTVQDSNFDITPLAAVEAFLGMMKLRVLNISEGGMAVQFEDGTAPTVRKGDVVDLSVSVRGRAHPVRVLIKSVSARSAGCSFVEPPRLFQSSLREFLRPKFLGETLSRNLDLSGHAGVLDLVEGSENYEVFLGQNQTGVFVWTTRARILLRFICVCGDLVFEWGPEQGLRTGRREKRRSEEAADAGILGDEGIDWDRGAETSVVNYFADILLAWLKGSRGAPFVEALVEDRPVPGEPELRFPVVHGLPQAEGPFGAS